MLVNRKGRKDVRVSLFGLLILPHSQRVCGKVIISPPPHLRLFTGTNISTSYARKRQGARLRSNTMSHPGIARGFTLKPTLLVFRFPALLTRVSTVLSHTYRDHVPSLESGWY